MGVVHLAGVDFERSFDNLDPTLRLRRNTALGGLGVNLGKLGSEQSG